MQEKSNINNQFGFPMKKQNGGKREGAGRKPSGRKPYLVRLKPDTMKKIRTLAKKHGAKALGEIIEGRFSLVLPNTLSVAQISEK